MASGSSSTAPKYLSTLLHSGSLTGLADRELLERFASRRDASDEAAELAFATLLSRHGPMVMRVCRAALKDRAAAEDAFQATFLVLAGRARSIRRRDSLAAWLHGVALRVSACARSRAARRERHERRFAEMTARMTEQKSIHAALSGEVDSVLHEEIGRLPRRFRTAVVLCYLEGQTHEMAAEQLSCPVGTIKSRLATAREKLRRRLTRRGVAPALIPAGLSGSGLLSGSASLPAALVEATVRGALVVGPGKGALAGIVSAEAVALMQGVLRTMATVRLTLTWTMVLVSGMAATGAGVAAFTSLGHRDGHGPEQLGRVDQPQAPSQKRKAAQRVEQAKAPQAAETASNPDRTKEAMVRDIQDQVKAQIGEYRSKEDAYRKNARNTKTIEEQKALQGSRPNPAFYAGALLQEAETVPGTPAAEEALIWIVTNLPYGSMAERAKEMIARDHARSDKIEPLFNRVQTLMPGSKATEQLFREALAKNPHHKIQGLACFYLARYLDQQATFIRIGNLIDPAQRANASPPIQKESWGQDFEDRLLKLNPETLEHEAASLDERVLNEFADIPLQQPFDMIERGQTTLGASSLKTLHEWKHLGIGKPAPEIEGVDLDGKPMRLSEYRGKVVVLYLCELRVMNGRAPITVSVREVSKRHATEPFVLLGVATAGPIARAGIPNPGRDEFKKALAAAGLPARFWSDPDQHGKPGLIQSAWNTRMGLYVLDHHGVIRHKHVVRPELLENAVTRVLKELADEKNRSKKDE